MHTRDTLTLETVGLGRGRHPEVFYDLSSWVEILLNCREGTFVGTFKVIVVFKGIV